MSYILVVDPIHASDLMEILEEEEIDYLIFNAEDTFRDHTVDFEFEFEFEDQLEKAKEILEGMD